jgi:hypothetical protein
VFRVGRKGWHKCLELVEKVGLSVWSWSKGWSNYSELVEKVGLSIWSWSKGWS